MNTKTLSVTVKEDRVLYYCHHCDISGVVKLDANKENTFKLDNSTKIKKSDLTPTDEAIKFFEKRGVSKATIKGLSLVYGNKWFGSINKTVPAVGFVYNNLDGTTAVKWRALEDKAFTQDGSASCLWGIEKFSGGDLVIVEGELDVVALAEAGIRAVSVPNGAPSHEPKRQSGGKKYNYLWSAREYLAKADRIIIACDNDNPGKILSKELSRRTGKHRSWRVDYAPGCKDANDVLVTYGKDAVAAFIRDATPWPINGIHAISEYADDVKEFHKVGPVVGVETGVQAVDSLYRCCPSSFTVVTGTPGSGKSTWLNWLMVRLAARSNQRFAVFSAEIPPHIHIAQLCSVYCERPFRGDNGMSEVELDIAMEWVNSHFIFLDTGSNDVDSIIEGAAAAVLRYGVNGLVIDPFNFVTVTSASNSDGEDGGVYGINKMLTRLKGFAIEYGLHVWLVAHPKKMMRGDNNKYPVPTGYDISGSAGFFNVADSGLTLSRTDADGESKLTNWKARFAHMGKLGARTMSFDPMTGKFSD